MEEVNIMERIALTVGAAAVLALGALQPVPAAHRSATAARSTGPIKAGELCCFNNPAYSGTCQVRPAEDETCESILAYLNNPMSQGKNYCGGTKVRQGWKQVACE
jgi:hypothetical protein